MDRQTYERLEHLGRLVDEMSLGAVSFPVRDSSGLTEYVLVDAGCYDRVMHKLEQVLPAIYAD